MSIKTLAISILCLVIFLFLGYGIFVLYVIWPVTSWNVDKAGVFGDSFGLLTSLFSGLAFAGIVLTILLQREELQLQREELRLTREEMKNQNATLKKQNFESTFFQMVRLHNEIVASMVAVKMGAEIAHARRCFEIFYGDLKNMYSSQKESELDDDDYEVMRKAWERFLKDHLSNLGHYFGNLYNIFKFIKDSEVGNKHLYSHIVRAQLSDKELLILFYNCLSNLGNEKFKPLAEEFALFNNLPKDKLLKQAHKSLYDEKAFGGKDV